MKHDWEYKKLGEVALIKGRIGFRGYTKNDLVEKGKGAITLSPANIIDYKISYEKCQYISWFKYEESPEIMIFNGDIIFAKTASIGKVALVDGLPDKATINPQFVVLKELKCNNKYLYYILRSDTFKQSISLITNGVAIPTVSQSNMGNISIPVPPLPIQQQIVSELDKVSEIIEKKKQQVKELDTLAQSIFYDMFGDPVENERGWDVKRVIDVVKLQRGYDLPVQSRCNAGSIPIYGANGIVGYHNKSMSQQGIITGRSGSLGEVFVSKVPFWPLNTSLFSIDTHGNDLVFLLYLMRNFDLKRFKQGAGVPTLNRNSFHGEKIINVPLPLQQSFAQKIEAIEKQKELINQSIKEAQTLFDARMDYYFGE